MSLTKTLTVNIIGAGIVTAALAVGAGFGSVTSPEAPAHATTVDQDACALVCASLSTRGHGGDAAPVFTAQGGGGNR